MDILKFNPIKIDSTDGLYWMKIAVCFINGFPDLVCFKSDSIECSVNDFLAFYGYAKSPSFEYGPYVGKENRYGQVDYIFKGLIDPNPHFDDLPKEAKENKK